MHRRRLQPLISQPANAPTWKGLAASCGHRLALGADGSVWGWGDNAHGQLGTAVGASTSIPTALGVSGAVQIAAGCQFSAVRKSDGTVWVWGFGANGAIGNGAFSDTPTPTKVSSLPSATSIAAKGGDVVCTVTDGSVYNWGENGNLQAKSTAGNSASPYPEPVAGRRVASGISSNYILLDDGTMKGWGRNIDYDLGLGTGSTSEGNPKPVHEVAIGTTNPFTNATAIAAGNHFAGALSGGLPYVWGWNGEGEFGAATPSRSTNPIEIVSYPVWVQMDGGWTVLYIRTSFGTVYGAGAGTSGQLGNGTATASNGWVQVTGLQSACAMAAGKEGGIALTP
jgi:alpha-tubulin suppressor-like RCC1 family protein